jgi:hypothetical protein
MLTLLSTGVMQRLTFQLTPDKVVQHGPGVINAINRDCATQHVLHVCFQMAICCNFHASCMETGRATCTVSLVRIHHLCYLLTMYCGEYEAMVTAMLFRLRLARSHLERDL